MYFITWRHLLVNLTTLHVVINEINYECLKSRTVHKNMYSHIHQFNYQFKSLMADSLFYSLSVKVCLL